MAKALFRNVSWVNIITAGILQCVDVIPWKTKCYITYRSSRTLIQVGFRSTYTFIEGAHSFMWRIT